MDSDEMKRKRVRMPAGPRGNQDQNRLGLAMGIEMSQHAASPIRAALVNLLCKDGVRKSRYGRGKGAALTGAGGFMATRTTDKKGIKSLTFVDGSCDQTKHKREAAHARAKQTPFRGQSRLSGRRHPAGQARPRSFLDSLRIPYTTRRLPPTLVQPSQAPTL